MRLKHYTSLLVFLVFVFQTVAQPSQRIPRSTPEAEGVSSKTILDFLDAAEKSKNEFHSFILIRNGKVIAETWWKPYAPDLKHTMYSVSKSFTATAVGFAVSEKKMTVNDKVISFFPEYLPPQVSPNLAALRVKDLLSMSVGQEPDPTGQVTPVETNWIRGFLALPVKYEPGSKFLYNSLATYMLSAIVQKVTGEKIIDYLRPRLFLPLGITDIDWETDPMGINTGGWGLRIRTEDLAKFGLLFLQKGKWNGKQILSADWVEEASTTKIMQNPNASAEAMASNDWIQGYAYQMWRCRHNAFRGDGAFGQYIIMMPEQNAVIAITSETSNMQDEMNLIWNILLPGMQSNKKLPADKNAYSQLTSKLKSLQITPLKNTSDSVFTPVANNKTWFFPEKKMGVSGLSLSFANQLCRMELSSDTAKHVFIFGDGKWFNGTTTRKGPSLVALAKNHFGGLPPSKVTGSYRWVNGHTLELKLRYIESPHTETFLLNFQNDKLQLSVQNSFQGERTKVEMAGTLVQ